jgi:succinoglycan biosynthesis transport protein ExoP
VAWHFADSACRDEWSLADCLRILYRHKAWVAGLTCLGILTAAAVSSVQPRVYQSRASLEVKPVNESFLDLRDIYPEAASSVDAPSYLQTQVELLQQDSLLQQVAQKLRLDDRPEYRSPQGLIPRLRQDIRIVPVHTSRLIQIIVDSRNADRSAELANTLALTFIEQGIRDRQAGASQIYKSLLAQLEELRRTFHPSSSGARGTPSPVEEANRHLYDTIAQKAYHARLASGLRLTNIRLVSPASPPLIPSRPNLPLNLAIGTVGGLLLAVACVMLLEQRKLVLRAPGEAGTYLDLPELGAIPQANTWTPSAMFHGSSNGKQRVERAALEECAGLSESFRATVASILSPRRNGAHPRVLLVTSSQPMEGKTTIVSNLGIALAAISNKVLLIDGDLRRPRLHKLFDEANSWGLSDVLREKNAVDELPLDVLAKKTSIPHLYLLPSGASTDNIFGLLHSGRMSRLLPLFREEFDYVLVDAPPCLEFADARIMARYAEELLLVVRANYTDRRTVQTAVQRLRFDGVPLMGVILNRWDPAPGDPYAYRALRPLGRQGVS